MKKYFPIYVDISEKPVLVVGGGKIAYRKIMYLLDFGADIDCISPEVISEINRLAEKGIIHLSKRKYKKNDAMNYKFVFAATNDPIVDEFIYKDCIAHSALLNVADVPALCSFILSSYIKKGDITINISSGGAAPFFVKHLKETISNSLPDKFEFIAELAAEFRSILVRDERYNDDETRNELINSFLQIDWTEIINMYGYNQAKDKMKELF